MVRRKYTAIEKGKSVKEKGPDKHLVLLLGAHLKIFLSLSSVYREWLQGEISQSQNKE